MSHSDRLAREEPERGQIRVGGSPEGTQVTSRYLLALTSTRVPLIYEDIWDSRGTEDGSGATLGKYMYAFLFLTLLRTAASRFGLLAVPPQALTSNQRVCAATLESFTFCSTDGRLEVGPGVLGANFSVGTVLPCLLRLHTIALFPP